MIDKTVQVNEPPANAEITLRYAVGRFSTNNDEFAHAIKMTRDKVRRYVESYGSKRSVRPYNILLSAPPGMGKSFIAKEIARDVGGDEIAIDEVYIASMSDVSEIDDVFRRVQSNYLNGKLPVVIFDEVDSKIGMLNVYNRFLSPMWDGNFFVSGQKHTLPPCIFFFAGSTITPRETIEEAAQAVSSKRDKNGNVVYSDFRSAWNDKFFKIMEKPAADKPEKIEDFITRIDDIILIPPINGLMSDDNAMDEYRSMACVLIRKYHQVNVIQGIAIDALAKNLKERGLRDTEKAIFISTTPDEGMAFSAKFLPDDFRMAMNIPKDALTLTEEQEIFSVVEEKR